MNWRWLNRFPAPARAAYILLYEEEKNLKSNQLFSCSIDYVPSGEGKTRLWLCGRISFQLVSLVMGLKEFNRWSISID